MLAQICYPLTSGTVRNFLTVATVLLFAATSITHAAATRGVSFAAVLVAVTAGGGFAVEAIGVATGWPFGSYVYAGTLGPRLLGVPLVIPFAWTMMAWPAWLVAGRLIRSSRWLRAGVAGWALASWDVFLDPQMVAAGHWRWLHPSPALPGIASVPLTNYAGWLAVALVLMTLLSAQSESDCHKNTVRHAPDRDNRNPIVQREAGAVRNCRTEVTLLPPPKRAGGGYVGLDVTYKDPTQHTPKRAFNRPDTPMMALYIWTYASSVLAHAVFLGLPASALAGAVAMGLVAVPLAVHLVRTHGR
ncbi:carotenoid biosynthesis protein [Fodinicola feengrottensis]|uniref:Carotenoid biosynthesis protein n=1 Tax=Fodinicola feengrottensis TaxID=435914 RepID=A0ABN2HSN8_9ACTN|nr:carotenoid biosynthesis protein [Fodinicola feengrottensis]